MTAALLRSRIPTEHSEPDIVWVTEPEFALINADSNFNRFRCIKAGEVQLRDVGSIKFELDWVTDVTTSPWYAQWLVPQLGPHAPAALLHDKLLELGFPRAEARRWMVKQLRLLPKVSRLRKISMTAGVAALDFVKYCSRLV